MNKILTLWNDEKKRGFLFQAALFALVAYGIYALIDNTLANMERRQISSGFGFLGNDTGFSIIQTPLEFTEESSYFKAYLVSLVNTLIVSFFGVIFATLLGFLIGISRLSKNFLLSKLSLCYVELFRNIPLLLQIFFWYHAVLKPLSNPRQIYEKGQIVSFGINNRGVYLPNPIYGDNMIWVLLAFLVAVVFSVFYARHAKRLQRETGRQLPVTLVNLATLILAPAVAFALVGFFSTNPQLTLEYAVMEKFQLKGGFKIIPEFIALFLALGIYTASFIAEIVRSGIQAVSHGQTEAARSLGFRDGQMLKLIIIPQAMKVIIPPMTSQYLNLIKNSSLATAIAYPDLVSVFAGTVLNQTGRAIEIIAITMGTYLTFSLLTSLLMNVYNRKNLVKER